MPNKDCEHCGKEMNLTEYYAERKKFCSKACMKAHKHWNKPLELNCLICGTPFSVVHSRKHKAKFCSKACHDLYMRDKPNPKTGLALTGRVSQNRISKEELKKEIIRLSKELGRCPTAREYQVIGRYSYDPIQLQFGKWENAVAYAGFKLRPLKERQREAAKKRWKNEEYRNKFIGEKHWKWKGGILPYYGPNWKIQSERARKRAKYQCQRCGKSQKDNGKNLDVHHLKPCRTFALDYLRANQLSNLVALCRKCHMRVENK